MNKKSFEALENIMLSVIKYFKWIVVGALVIFVLTGVYKVESNEVAVVLRFGRLTGASTSEQIKKPGLHFALPYIIDEIIKIPVETIQEQNVATHYNYDSSVSEDVKSTGYAITGDSNIVLINSVVKYKVSDPVQYALYISEVSSIVNGVTSGEMTSMITSMTVDSILTTEKTKISDTLKSNVQTVLDGMNCGVQITNIELTNVVPPSETKDAFDKVTASTVKKQTLIQQAHDYTASAIPQAEAEADDLVGKAKTNQSELIAKATKEVAEFDGLYEQFKLNPQVVMDGVFRNRVSEVLSKTGATIIVPDGDSSAKVILP